MLLRKATSLLGIGSATIDLVLNKEIYFPGEKVTGFFTLKGGIIEQYIKRVDCSLIMFDTEKQKATIVDTTSQLISRQIHANEDNQLPFHMTIPSEAEASTDNLIYYFNTKLIFDEGVESKDQDIICIIRK